jgi:hypothetical protein
MGALAFAMKARRCALTLTSEFGWDGVDDCLANDPERLAAELVVYKECVLCKDGSHPLRMKLEFMHSHGISPMLTR